MNRDWDPALWRNQITKEIYESILDDWRDPLGIAQQWLDMGAGSAAELLAEQLRKDFYSNWVRRIRPFDPVFACLARTGFRRVDWRQVAGRLLERAMPIEVDEDEWDGQEGDAATA